VSANPGALPSAIGSFEDIYNMWPDTTRMTPEEEELSFMNVWLVFRHKSEGVKPRGPAAKKVTT
jgi:hypothetical protein